MQQIDCHGKNCQWSHFCFHFHICPWMLIVKPKVYKYKCGILWEGDEVNVSNIEVKHQCTSTDVNNEASFLPNITIYILQFMSVHSLLIGAILRLLCSDVAIDTIMAFALFVARYQVGSDWICFYLLLLYQGKRLCIFAHFYPISFFMLQHITIGKSFYFVSIPKSYRKSNR